MEKNTSKLDHLQYFINDFSLLLMITILFYCVIIFTNSQINWNVKKNVKRNRFQKENAENIGNMRNMTNVSQLRK